MQPRMKNPALIVPGAMEALQKLGTAALKTGVPATTLYLVEMRASQINGCSVCLDMHSRELKAAGEPDERIFMVGAWREAPYFSDAQRAALALTEAATRLADHAEPVRTTSGRRQPTITTSRSSPGWWSRSRRSTLSTASTPPHGKLPVSGSDSGSPRVTLSPTQPPHPRHILCSEEPVITNRART